ncbi:MAG: alpha-amylase family glycosyl hydrolase [Candidatus Ranarchaeia archaeon]
MSALDQQRARIIGKLEKIYPGNSVPLFNKIKEAIKELNVTIASQSTVYGFEALQRQIDQRDVVLITYADAIINERQAPLQSLCSFCKKYFQGFVSTVHVLPFYIWDIDRGFSVVDFYSVDPRYGTWKDFQCLSDVFPKRMVDLVLNHASVENQMIQGALIGDQRYNGFVISFSSDNLPSRRHLDKIVRPRATPVLSRYYVFKRDDKKIASLDKPGPGDRLIRTGWVWTTFSRPEKDSMRTGTRQVDLNFSNPNVFLEMLKTLLFYVQKGATWIRLDAAPYLWKEPGTQCIHLAQTHMIIEIFHDILQNISPNVVLIAEVNEPQSKVQEYLGRKGAWEADLVYQFSHYPLAVHAVTTGDASYYLKWLNSLHCFNGRQLITVYGSHDSMGLKPVRGFLPERELFRLVSVLTREHGALANYARLAGGTEIVYELCGTPWSIINGQAETAPQLQLSRYLAVLALACNIRGVPGIYVNAFFGVPNSEAKLDENRSINRQSLSADILADELADSGTITHQVFYGLKRMLNIRGQHAAFSPWGPPAKPYMNRRVVTTLLCSPDRRENILSLVNVSSSNHHLKLETNMFQHKGPHVLLDLLSGEKIIVDNGQIGISFKPYQSRWLLAKQA